MPPSVSASFDTLVNEIEQGLVKAAELCKEIKKTRHIGKSHTQLDQLEESLTEAPAFVQKTVGKAGESVNGEFEFFHPELLFNEEADAARASFAGYAQEIADINVHLERVAHPTRHHSNHHHHRSLLFPDFDPVHHKEKTDPHFHEVREKWEMIREGMKQAIAEMGSKVEKKGEDKSEKKEEVSPMAEKSIAASDKGSTGGKEKLEVGDEKSGDEEKPKGEEKTSNETSSSEEHKRHEDQVHDQEAESVTEQVAEKPPVITDKLAEATIEVKEVEVP